MAALSYDILFSGAVKPGAAPAEVRARLQQLFKLNDEVAEQLFSGRTVALKRNLDAAHAARFRDVFLDAGAIVQLVESGEPQANTPSAEGALELAPRDGPPLEAEPAHTPPAIDTSHLSLIPGCDWTLEDCASAPPPVSVPDVSHLRILDPAPADRAQEGPRD